MSKKIKRKNIINLNLSNIDREERTWTKVRTLDNEIVRDSG